MYKIYTIKFFVPFRHAQKSLLIMRLIVIILITSMMQVSAGSFAQKISLSEKNITLDKVFKKISQQSGYDFLVFSSIIKDAQPITINVKDAELKDVLDLILHGQHITYKINNKTIILREVDRSVIDMIRDYLAEVTIYGTIITEDGSPLPGATVKIKGTNKTMAADKAGKFAITVPDDKSVLVFSFIGFATQEVSVKQNMVVTMQTETSKLNETVVVGYGTTKRKDLTGAVSSVSVGEIKDVPFTTIDQALTGKAAGVQVIQADGSPGGVAKIRIRGGTSLLGGNDPLYVIDGVQMQVQDNYLTTAAEVVSPVERAGNDDSNSSVSSAFARTLNSLAGLNINDIESIDILKDASATAIYGSKGANGVVIITTKKGKYNQKPILEGSYNNVVSVARREKLLNRDQYISILKEGATNLNAAHAAAQIPDDPTATAILTDPNFFGKGSTDWLSLVLRNAVTQNASISVRGGNVGSTYYTSLSYLNQEGVVKGTDFTRISGKISLDNQIISRLRISTNLDYGFTSNNITDGAYTQALFMPPTIVPYNADGSPKAVFGADLGAFDYQGFQNPLFLLDGVNKTNTVSLLGSLAAELDILPKELKLRSSVAVNYDSYNQNNYQPSTVLIASPSGTGSSNNGTATQGQSQNVNLFYENTLTWDKQFNQDNHLSLVAGTSWQISKFKSFTASGQGFPDDTYLNNLSSAAIALPPTGVSGQSSLLSFYGRANYSLFDKYLFTFTGRSDASSKFPVNNRVGYFPSGGVAWRLSQEKFLKEVTWVDEIKLRASAGTTGTQNIGDNLFYTLYSPVSYAGLNGLSPTQLGNNSLKWESTLQKDAGVDAEFFKSQLRLSIGYYDKTTSDALFPISVANSSGFGGVTANIAKIQNRGLEIEISGEFIRKKDFQWSGSLNISGNRSKVLALPNNPALNPDGSPGDPS
ncbi:MAG: TonB-dependent receptor, partial [Mucilaginibacter sp.]|nr:TonB-dependent receptor [Mucilaginibacter sp.]